MSDNSQIHALLNQRLPAGPLHALLPGLHFTLAPDGLHIAFAHRHFEEFYKSLQAEFESALRKIMDPDLVLRLDSGGSCFPIHSPLPSDPFEDFLTSPKNHPALVAVKQFCALGRNPKLLIIYGAHDTGKTHLLNLMHHALARGGHPSELIRAREIRQIRSILLVDDLLDLAGQGELQDTLCQCLDEFPAALALTGKPADLEKFSPRLACRLEAALWMELHQPDLVTRITFTEDHAKKMGLNLARRQIMAICRHSPRFSAILGLLQKIEFYGKLTGQVFTPEELEKLAHPANQPASWQRITGRVALRLGVRQADLLGPSRKQELVFARQAAMYLCRTELGLSYPELGRLFGGRDHATVIHGIKKIQQLRKVDQDINNLLTELENGPV